MLGFDPAGSYTPLSERGVLQGLPSGRDGPVKNHPVLVVYFSLFTSPPYHRYYALYHVLAAAGQLPPTMSLGVFTTCNLCCGIEMLTKKGL
jgi:hypothetical protein